MVQATWIVYRPLSVLAVCVSGNLRFRFGFTVIVRHWLMVRHFQELMSSGPDHGKSSRIYGLALAILGCVYGSRHLWYRSFGCSWVGLKVVIR